MKDVILELIQTKQKAKRTILSDDGVRVGAAVTVDVIDGFWKTSDSFDGAV